jgi:cytochrome d oxidase subunit CydB
MDIIWFVVFALLLVGYFALEGFDLGVGMLLPFLGRGQEGRDRLVAAIAPYVLANEVWLVAVAGTLFGVFPSLDAEVLGGLYPLMVTLLVSWMLRDAGLWFRRRLDGRLWRPTWDVIICAGSFGLALSLGSALAAAATGLRVTPLSLLGGVLVAALFAFHGRTFIGWRLAGAVGEERTWAELLRSAVFAGLPAAVVLAATGRQLFDAMAPAETLSALGIVALPLVPIMVAAQVWVWRTFRPLHGTRNGDGPYARLPSFF